MSKEKEKDLEPLWKTGVYVLFCAFVMFMAGFVSGLYGDDVLYGNETETITVYPEFELTDFEVNDLFYNLDPGDEISVYYKVQDNWLQGCIHLENNNKTGDGSFPISTAEYCKKIKEIR